jgi:hypothetical protein
MDSNVSGVTRFAKRVRPSWSLSLLGREEEVLQEKECEFLRRIRACVSYSVTAAHFFGGLCDWLRSVVRSVERVSECSTIYRRTFRIRGLHNCKGSRTNRTAASNKEQTQVRGNRRGKPTHAPHNSGFIKFIKCTPNVYACNCIGSKNAFVPSTCVWAQNADVSETTCERAFHNT